MPDYLLSTDHLCKSFGRRTVVDGLELRVPRGGVYGFLGRNGAGKTTTIRTLLGILHPDSGQITYDGHTVSHATKQMKRRIGYVSQQQHFYEWMKVERLARFVRAFYPTWDHDEFHRLLDVLRIERRQRVGELSGGTKMKLAMALALAHKPKLLILDEPTAGVDPIARREILDTLRRQVEDHGRTVFFSTHHISEVEDIGDSVGVLHRGELFYQGSLDGLSQRVRRVRGLIPEGFDVLHRAGDHVIAHATAERWAAADFEHEPATLEEAFVAIARQDGA
jgi:ABC-2 type transport system ATP-binding protein